MVVTILASILLLVLVAVIFYGYGFIMKSARARGEADVERCTLCRVSYDKGQLVERHVGDSRILYFCKMCIGKLSDDSARL